VVDQFIPNHTNLDSEDKAAGGLVHVITGPNASGKSVYLKQVKPAVIILSLSTKPELSENRSESLHIWRTSVRSCQQRYANHLTNLF
jgi:hypothetical protein